MHMEIACMHTPRRRDTARYRAIACRAIACRAIACTAIACREIACMRTLATRCSEMQGDCMQGDCMHGDCMQGDCMHAYLGDEAADGGDVARGVEECEGGRRQPGDHLPTGRGG